LIWAATQENIGRVRPQQMQGYLLIIIIMLKPCRYKIGATMCEHPTNEVPKEDNTSLRLSYGILVTLNWNLIIGACPYHDMFK
jgi:hypothetical protein